MDLEPLKRAISLRSSGQYNAALSTLAAEDPGGESQPEARRQSLLERLLCNVLSHNFNAVKELATLICKERSTWPEDETDLFHLLYAYARFHTAIDLAGALDVSNKIYVKHLRDTEPLEFKSVHVLLLCFSSMVAHLGNKLMDILDGEFLQKLEGLRATLLENGNYNDLGMVHLAESECLNARGQIQHLNATMKSSGFRNIDLEVHLKVFQLNACYDMDDEHAVVQLASDLWSSSLVEHNYERHLWAQHLQVKNTKENSEVDNNFGRLNAVTANLQATGELRQAKGFLHARRHLKNGFVDQYMEDVLALLQQSQSCRLPKSPADLIEAVQTHDTSELSQSAWLFWSQYMDTLTADMNAQNRRPLAIQCVQTFFEVQTECTIPELQYTLTTVPAECYEEIGDMHQAIHWRSLGAEIAKGCNDEDIKDEAECELRLMLADDAIVVLDDPHGAQQKSWNTAKLQDLEHLYEDTKKRGKWKYAFFYAQNLLQKELDTAIAQGLSPTGQKWYPNTLEALNHLQHVDQLKYRPYVSFVIAHAKFDCKDYARSIEDLERVIEASKIAKDGCTEQMALFTSARARLHLYQTNHEASYWSSANNKLDNCLALCTQEQRLDRIACCHSLKAILWYSKQGNDKEALQNTLYHINQARNLWDEERKPWFGRFKFDNLLTRYMLSGRNARSPYSIFGTAVDACITLGDHHQAWSWIEYSKARALYDSLNYVDDGPHMKIEAAKTDDKPFEHFIINQDVVLVHWMIHEEKILLCVSQNSTAYSSWELNCTKSAVEDWYHNWATSNDDLSDPITGQEILSELQELVRPLICLANRNEERIFILCPTQILFKIPLHAIPVDGKCILDLAPVVYTHSFAVLKRLMQENSTGSQPNAREAEFFASPTGDTPAGSEIVRKIVAQYGGRQHINVVSKEEFVESASRSSWVHFHGHVISEDHPLKQALLFCHGEKLAAREVFKLDLSSKRPVMLLIGCGSGVERLDPGDEPLGLVSGLLFAGASSVIATMWPIQDRLSGAKFSERFYGIDSDEKHKFEGSINLARRMRAAVLSIKNNIPTRAPYFWAGFVLYGQWKFTHANCARSNIISP
ncbi:tetratricopeptide repeat protein [Metarhizium guizhouense ARSEF 977]|uniref:Tetratricopeptide repeat protein n=1 Tax=Metarhizium guizhouense (strain ARSEF 977) TaxID=1276136 RepID=A0A0B4GER1_METGA|nr:tetratricopeptide repeat protein [Metarhizium guizhouense ARSEF 977]